VKPGRHWRVPTVEELASLVDRSRLLPASSFPDMPLDNIFWSSSPYVDDADHAWIVYFGDGSVASDSRKYEYAVRLVRGG
jgi:hypothetical protein